MLVKNVSMAMLKGTLGPTLRHERDGRGRTPLQKSWQQPWGTCLWGDQWYNALALASVFLFYSMMEIS